jgi:hypothetical protein
MKARFIMSLLALFLFSGCIKYIEKPTPTSSVPPPPAQIQPPQVQEIPRYQPNELPAPNPTQLVLDSTITREGAVGISAGVQPGVSMRFKDAYSRASKPKMAVFVNRTLSDDVREWNTGARIAASGDGSTTTSQSTPFGKTEETVKGDKSLAVQTSLDVSPQRSGPRETYIWEFENGFMQPLVRSGAILVDRATILRLTSRSVSQKYDPIETKKNEMEALVNYADVIVEILITRSPSAPSGYEFKAVAKELKNGRILAMVTSLNWDKANRPHKVRATDKGYEILEDRSMPRIVDLSQNLAQDLMNELTSTWGN